MKEEFLALLRKVKREGIINNTVAKTIKQGKDIILNNVERNIEDNFNKQISSLEFAEKYMNNCKKYFENKYF